MATIRASWKRTVQVKPYESETLELSVEQNVDGDGPRDDADAKVLVRLAQDLDRTLAAAGDALILERLNIRVVEATPGVEAPEPGPVVAPVRRPARPEPVPETPTEVIPMTKVEAPADADVADEYLFAK